MCSRLIFLIPLIFMCCVDQKDYNLQSVESSPLVDVPLVSGQVSIRDILNQTDSAFVHVTADSLIYLEYATSIISAELQNQFQIPDKSIQQNFSLPHGTIPPHSNDLRSDSVSVQVDFGLSPEQLSGIDFKSGTINYSTHLSSPALNYYVLVTSSDFISKSTGQSLTISAGNGSVPMENYHATLDKNKFTLKMVLVYKATSQAVNITGNSPVNVEVDLAAMRFNRIDGFFGDHIVSPPPGIILIDAFGESLYSANVSVVQPIVALTVTNDYGVPMTVSFLDFEARKRGLKLDGQIDPSSPVAVLFPSAAGSSAITNIEVTNAQQMVDFGGTDFFYQIKGETNRGLTSGNNFLMDTSKLRVKLGITIPLYGHVSKIALADTSSIDLSKLDQTKVETASLRVNIANQIPLSANVQCYLTDAHYVILDSLLTVAQTQLIKGSIVDQDGNLSATGLTDLLLPLDPEAVNKLFNSAYIIVKATLATSVDVSGKSVDVKFKSGYAMKINLGLTAKLKASITF